MMAETTLGAGAFPVRGLRIPTPGEVTRILNHARNFDVSVTLCRGISPCLIVCQDNE